MTPRNWLTLAFVSIVLVASASGCAGPARVAQNSALPLAPATAAPAQATPQAGSPANAQGQTPPPFIPPYVPPTTLPNGALPTSAANPTAPASAGAAFSPGQTPDSGFAGRPGVQPSGQPYSTVPPVASYPPANSSMPPAANWAQLGANGPASPTSSPPGAIAPWAGAPGSENRSPPGMVVRGQDPGSGPGFGPGAAVPTYQPPGYQPPSSTVPNYTLPAPGTGPYGNLPTPPTESMEPPGSFADIVANVQETQTGRFQFGVGVNSDAGVTGQIVIDERNFDWQRVPTSFDEVINGTAWRGAGQGFRMEAMPGNQVQRYLVSFTEPYLFGYSPVSLNLSAFYFNRGYFDYDEERLGGRVALGYRLSPDLSVSGALRAESVDISDPRVIGVPELDRIVGNSELYSGRVTLTHDTRDIPFFPTEGHYFEMAYEQAFGTFDYPRAELDYRRYFLIRERPDGSGRHTLAFSGKLGFSGVDTPMYENYFAGGYSTLRGFDFRGASPITGSVIVGGRFRFLGSTEYFFPLTADDMIKGVVFCDFGTVEKDIEIDWDNFRVAPGFGLRINIPALGPAPLALDFAVPVTHADTDNIQNFSFFFGFGR